MAGQGDSNRAILFALGARVDGPHGIDTNAIEHLLGTDSRNPAAKHQILEMWIQHGFEPPDTPVMAVHRGRIDLLEAHLARNPDLLTRTFEKPASSSSSRSSGIVQIRQSYVKAFLSLEPSGNLKWIWQSIRCVIGSNSA